MRICMQARHLRSAYMRDLASMQMPMHMQMHTGMHARMHMSTHCTHATLVYALYRIACASSPVLVHTCTHARMHAWTQECNHANAH
jgi:hypothetical protein